ncbi:MAG: hypothetical protein GF308_17010 [Candidatus Heimdallarchaeota archaeon]|nr:hypothetical protein [Candidatus Heimdallarchaeota archaeon]
MTNSKILSYSIIFLLFSQILFLSFVPLQKSESPAEFETFEQSQSKDVKKPVIHSSAQSLSTDFTGIVGTDEWTWLSSDGGWVFPDMNLFANPNVGYQTFAINDLLAGDTYLVNIGLIANSTLTITLDVTNTSGDLDLALYDSNDQIVGLSTNSEGLDEWITFTPTLSGNYTVEVRHDEAESTQPLGIGTLYLIQNREGNFRRIFMRGKDQTTNAAYDRTIWAERRQNSFYGVFVNVPDRTPVYTGLDMYELRVYEPEEIAQIKDESGQIVPNTTIGFGHKEDPWAKASAQTFGKDMKIVDDGTHGRNEELGNLIEVEGEAGVDWITIIIQEEEGIYELEWFTSPHQVFAKESFPTFSFLAADVDQLNPENFTAIIYDSDNEHVTTSFDWEYELLSSEGTNVPNDRSGYLWNITLTPSSLFNTTGSYRLELWHEVADTYNYSLPFSISSSSEDSDGPVLSDPYVYPDTWYSNEFPMVCIKAEDELNKVAKVELNYQIFNGTDWSSPDIVEMTNTLNQTYSFAFDLRSSTGLVNPGNIVNFTITAYDTLGQTTTDDNNQKEYSFMIHQSRPQVTIHQPFTGEAKLNSLYVYLQIVDPQANSSTPFQAQITIDDTSVRNETLVGTGFHNITDISLSTFDEGIKILSVVITNPSSNNTGTDRVYFNVVELFAAKVSWTNISPGQTISGTPSLEFTIRDEDASSSLSTYIIAVELVDNESTSYVPEGLMLDGSSEMVIESNKTEHSHTIKFDTISIPNGHYDLIIRVREGDLPENEDRVAIHIENIGPFYPRVTIESPSLNEEVAQQFTLTFSITDYNYPLGTNTTAEYLVEIRINSLQIGSVRVVNGTGEHSLNVDLTGSDLSAGSATLEVLVEGPSSSLKGADELTIQIPELVPPSTTPTAGVVAGIDWWIWILVGVVAVGLIVTIVVLLRKKPKREISFE